MIDHLRDDHVKVTIHPTDTLTLGWTAISSACWSSAIASTQLSSIYELVLHGASAESHEFYGDQSFSVILGAVCGLPAQSARQKKRTPVRRPLYQWLSLFTGI